MKYLIISAFAVIGFLAATTLLRSHSPSIDRPAAASDAISIEELNARSSAKLSPIDGIEDQSFVFSIDSKQSKQP